MMIKTKRKTIKYIIPDDDREPSPLNECPLISPYLHSTSIRLQDPESQVATISSKHKKIVIIMKMNQR